MRLLNVETLQLESFYDSNVPEYAALSHTWGTEEVTFHDLATDSVRSKNGWTKILASAKEAKKHECQYIWIDTCCIDKSSSAELSEAINSMFRWYRRPKVCLAYLEDITEHDESNVVEIASDADSEFEVLQLNPNPVYVSKSRWFKRGWTLQELIAPDMVYFYDSTWANLGEKRSLGKEISTATGIDLDVLYSHKLLYTKSIARRMSWAAERQTTRVEDVAYCLLGIFNINMPLFYGEGEKAFIRLQEEIMRSEYDQTLFAWNHKFPNTLFGTCVTSEDVILGVGVLAPHPVAFRDSANIIPHSKMTKPHVLTNRGVEFHTRTARNGDPTPTHSHFALLQCSYSDKQNTHIAIPLQRMSNLGLPYSKDEFCRVPNGKLRDFKFTRMKYFFDSHIYLLKSEPLSSSITPKSFHRCWLRERGRKVGVKFNRARFCQYPVDCQNDTFNSWNYDTNTMTWRKLWGGARAALLFSNKNDDTAFIIVLTFLHLLRKDDLVSINIHIEPVQCDVQGSIKPAVEQVSLREFLRKDIPLGPNPGLNEGDATYTVDNQVMTVSVKKEVMFDGDAFVLDLLYSGEKRKFSEEAPDT